MPPDPITRQLGGMRGVVIGAASKEVAKNGEGSTILLKDGTLLHLFSRHMRPLQNPEKYENPDLWPAIIAASRSTDKGLTWSEPEVLFRSTTGENAMQPSLARLANGEIGVSYSRIDSYSAATKVFRWSGDEGRTWSDEVLISPAGAYWTSAHDRMITLASGRVLLPLHHKKSVRPEHMITQVAYSDDNGRSWKLAAQQLDVAHVIPGFRKTRPGAQGFWEASIAPVADGSLFMLGRTYGGWLYQTRSRDGGLTWGQPRPSRLMSSAAPGRVERIPGTDNLLVVWNSCCLNETDGLLGSRLTLSSAVSTDGGETWKWQREIESVTPGRGHRVEYPAINIYDGQVYLTYRAQAGLGAGELQMQEYLSILPVSWFTAASDVHRPWLAFFREQAAVFDAQKISSAIDSLPSKPPTNRVIIDQRGHAVKVARVQKRNGPLEVQNDEERVFYILNGSGTLRLGAESAQREEKMLPGSVISVPRGMPYQIIAADSDVSFLVVEIR
jgi:sialidase-1